MGAETGDRIFSRSGLLDSLVNYHRFDGRRAPMMEEARVSRGWVLDSSRTTELMRTYTLPEALVFVIKPDTSLFGRLFEQRVHRQLTQLKFSYGSSVLVAMVADMHSANAWNVGPLIPHEFLLPKQELINLRNVAIQDGDTERSEMLYRTLVIQIRSDIYQHGLIKSTQT